jgi:transcriptional regulator with XRE-family HTH domain
MSGEPDGRGGRRDACRRCGAWLRRGRAGVLCESCAGQVNVADVLRDAGFYEQEPIRQALARAEFGYLFRAVRRTAQLTQQELGDLLDLDQDRISRIERGHRPLRDITVVARVASQLGIPPRLLGFSAGSASVEASTAASREVDWVRRRDFTWTVAGVVLGVGLEVLDVDRLEALLPTPPAARATAQIGAADVTAIEQATAALREADFSRGGAGCRAMAVTKLRSVLALHDAVCTSVVRDRLMLATADLGMVAAWTSYDAERHNDARQLWMIALSVAQQAEHPRASDLTANLLLDMAHQALHLRRPREALHLVQLGYGAAANSTRPVSACTSSYLASSQAWCHAAQGDAQACQRALGESVERYARAPGVPAPWAVHVDTAELAAQYGHAHYTLALACGGDRKQAARAVPLLREATDGYQPANARSRAVNLAGLAGAHAMTGDLNAAVHTGQRAVEEITALASPRAYERLRILDGVLKPHSADPGVGEVRSQIHAAFAVA